MLRLVMGTAWFELPLDPGSQYHSSHMSMALPLANVKSIMLGRCSDCGKCVNVPEVLIILKL